MIVAVDEAPTVDIVLPRSTVMRSRRGLFNSLRTRLSRFLSELFSMDIWILFKEKNAVSEAAKKAQKTISTINVRASVGISTEITTPL
jgi:hypothetical protein